jgi:chromosome segregation protein
LILKGFKSFAAPTTLHFEQGVTCIVGPNGSGKSNVVDALAWVMGEQGAKSLRGGKMEDVIFSGTTGRAPLGRAEVALTIDNSDGALPIDYTEITISRTLFRNGASEYAINGDTCRLLDVQELLSDSGIGREMHVVVGQGQLDSILRAAPEDRRGFIEEAAGVLKHRKRKEKALRKLDAMQTNLTRLSDLTAELRRQLKPLGRQADVARRAVVIQSDVRDARLRIMADDLTSMRRALAAEVADETALRERQSLVEAEIAGLQASEAQLEADAKRDEPAVTLAQETWFTLSSQRERFHGLEQLAVERVRYLQPEDEVTDQGRDPEHVEAEARALRAEEFELGREVTSLREALTGAIARRETAELAFASEEQRVAEVERAHADRREGLAVLAGDVNAAQSAVAARETEITRLTEQVREARERSSIAQSEFQRVEVNVVGLGQGELGLDAEHEVALGALAQADADVERIQAEINDVDRRRVAVAARGDALELSLRRTDASGTLLASSDRVAGMIGSLASMIHVDPGAQAAVAAVLGDTADAVVVRGVRGAVEALVVLKELDAGRATIIVADDSARHPSAHSATPPAGRWLRDSVRASGELSGIVDHLLGSAVLVSDGDAAARGVELDSTLTWVTEHGDVFRSGLVRGGSTGAPSLVEVQAALDEARTDLERLTYLSERLTFDHVAARERQSAATVIAEGTLRKLHESDAQMAAVAEQLGILGQTARSAAAEADRLERALEAARGSLTADREMAERLRTRLAASHGEPEPSIGVDRRPDLRSAVTGARTAEVDSRLSVRTAEERVSAVSERAARLEHDASHERSARAAAVERRERRAAALVVAQAVLKASRMVAEYVERSTQLAHRERTTTETRARERNQNLSHVRARLRELGTESDALRDSVHRDEMARAEQRLRIEQVEERALSEFGVEPDVLIAEYSPDQLVPPSLTAPGDDIDPHVPAPQPYPYVRAEQERRLAVAEKGLALLGRVNPLALEEFTAMEERHRFLTEQLDDLKRTREHLLAIVREVDARVRQVFSEAYADVAREFEGVFARLFPGGEGRLVLTDPSDMLTSGVDIEARPPGKRIKRLSLLSSGERSLTAVAFLVSLFKARPSPFYVLDEVEAALDDVNLGRLIDIIDELRGSSQLIVITHQKRTMEIADALYGVSMRGDGVTQVISQRLREPVSA